MTVAQQTSYAQATGNGATTVFPFQFLTLVKTDLSVYLDATLKTVDVDYTVSGLGVTTGGSVTFLVAPGNGVIVSIQRTMRRERTTDYQNLGDFDANTVNPDFDRPILIEQDIDVQLGRSIRTPANEVATVPVLPSIANRAGKYIAFDSSGQPTASAGTGNDSALRTDLANGTVGPGTTLVAVKKTTAETTAGITPTNYYRIPEPVYDLLRIGLVPNSTAERAANSTKLKALLSPQVTGPEGWFMFTNTTGADTYYFDSVTIEIRDGCRLNLCGCTVDFGGAYNVLNNSFGFFTFIRNVEICNGKINVNYNGTGGLANGMAMRIGGRSGSGFAGAADIHEEDFPTNPMGNIWVHDLNIVTNNPNPSVVVLLLGGLRNTRVERIFIDGGSGANTEDLIYYEFGDWHYDGTVPTYTTTHATLEFSDIVGKNINNALGGGVLHVVGANSAVVRNIHGDGVANVVAFRCGEALFYNVGPPFVLAGSSQTRWHTISNITGVSLTSHLMSLVGSESKAAGYLNGTAGVTEQKQCDLQGFIVNGFNGNRGLYFNGPTIINGGTIKGSTGDGIIVGADCGWFSVNGVNILDNAAEGFRANFADSLRGTPRKLRGEVIGCRICGNGTEGIAFDSTDDILIADNQVGYTTARGDAANETVQGTGINISNTSLGVRIVGNYVTTKGGSFAYAIASPADATIYSAFGQKNITGSGTFKWGGAQISGSITYSASMTPDLFVANNSIITATNGTAFTINAPLNPFHSQISTYTIRNTAGGALGAATWNAAFKLGAAWTQPANGFSRSVGFRYDGTNYIELWRSAADVAN
jgi:hypothetical protein